MPQRMRSSIFLGLLSSLTLGFPSLAVQPPTQLGIVHLAQAQLTESNVRDRLQALVAQVNQKLDPDKLIQFFAPSATITLTMKELGPPTTFTRDQYLQLLQANSPQIQAYKANLEIGTINISGNQAVVQYTTQEEATYTDSLIIKSISQGTMKMEVQNGQLLITEFTVTTEPVGNTTQP